MSLILFAWLLTLHPDATGRVYATYLVCNDFSAHKALFKAGVMEAGCTEHAQRRFHELSANQSGQIADEALKLFGALYDVERQIQQLDDD